MRNGTLKGTVLLALLGGLAWAGLAQEAGTRQIKLMEDRDQDYMTTKVYALEHVRAADLMPFVRGAVLRANDESWANRLSYKAGEKEFLVVSMPDYMIVDIDDMVAKLDRPGTKDDEGSLVEGTGIYRYAYCPEHRGAPEMLAALVGTVASADGAHYYDASTNMFYWKDSKSDGDNTLNWLQVLDRPLPQMELTLRVYEMHEGDLKELGIDYVSWKNGPALNLFGAGLNMMSLSSHEEVMDEFNQAFDVASNAQWAWGGFLVAPQIDASFLRMLAQKGNARIHSTASLTVSNSFDDTVGIAFGPGFQNIVKDGDQQLQVVAGAVPDFVFTVTNPIICFNDAGAAAANLLLTYQVAMSDTVERNNQGAELVTYSDIASALTLAAGNEKLLATFERDEDVAQQIAMPFLGEVPGLKYLFGTSTRTIQTAHMFVTVEARAIHPDSEIAPWAGQVVTAAQILQQEAAATQAEAK